MAIKLSNTTLKEGTACNVTGWGKTDVVSICSWIQVG